MPVWVSRKCRSRGAHGGYRGCLVKAVPNGTVSDIASTVRVTLKCGSSNSFLRIALLISSFSSRAAVFKSRSNPRGAVPSEASAIEARIRGAGVMCYKASSWGVLEKLIQNLAGGRVEPICELILTHLPPTDTTGPLPSGNIQAAFSPSTLLMRAALSWATSLSPL